MVESQFDALHRRLITGRRDMVGGALAMLGAAAVPSLALGKGNNKCNRCRKKTKKLQDAPCTCCPPGQVRFGSGCCPTDHICNDNQGQQVCCQHRCFSGLCCPCDNVIPCQQCVIDVSRNPPRAGCQQYCSAGQFCMPGGCTSFP
jgi:hypothetical protein